MNTVDYASKEQLINKYRNFYELPQLLLEKKEIEKILKTQFKDILKHNLSSAKYTAKQNIEELNKFDFWWDIYKEIISLIVLKQKQ